MGWRWEAKKSINKRSTSPVCACTADTVQILKKKKLKTQQKLKSSLTAYVITTLSKTVDSCFKTLIKRHLLGVITLSSSHA